MGFEYWTLVERIVFWVFLLYCLWRWTDSLTWVYLSAMHKIRLCCILWSIYRSMPLWNEHCVYLKGCCGSLAQRYVLPYWFRNCCCAWAQAKGWLKLRNNFLLASCACVLCKGKWKIVQFWKICYLVWSFGAI